MISTTRSLLLVALLATTQAFAPTTHLSQQQRQQQSARFDALEVVDDSAPEDPFKAYQPTAEQRAVVFKDTKIGSGYTVGDEPSQQLKIKYTATFLEPNPGSKFDFSENFICKTGQSKILPGFEEGLKGMSVGGKRTIKIPPNKGYGDQWYKGTIPPNSHLQFECELLGIDQTPQEEFMTALDNFGVGRAIGITVCVGYLAASPFLNI
mmetsp:Transcript_5464/g.11271  ORF Transcript_5464/g.11271 Transcript_5464/m.11271 type:complete len:208 (-) Transcript_5464:154-777(-)